MDPITAITTVITIGTFVKDLYELALKIKSSLAQVRLNEKALDDVMDNIILVLSDLDHFVETNEDILKQSAELFIHLERLRVDMSGLLQRCEKLMPRPTGSRGIHRVKVKIKRFHMRDEIEAEILRLKNTVTSCLSQFTTFAAARTEHRTVRIEHTLLIQGSESKSKMRQLEVLMTRMLLDTSFGEQIVNNMAFTMRTSSSQEGIEFDYIRLQITRMQDHLQHMLLPVDDSDTAKSRYSVPFEPCYNDIAGSDDTVSALLTLVRSLQDTPSRLTIQNGAMDLHNIALDLSGVGLVQESLSILQWVIRYYRSLVPIDTYTYLPSFALALKNAASFSQSVGHYTSAIDFSKSALDAVRLINETYPQLDFRALLALTLRVHADGLQFLDEMDDSVPFLEEAAEVYYSLAKEVTEGSVKLEPGSVSTNPALTTILDACKTFFSLSISYCRTKQPIKGYEAVQKGLVLMAFVSPEGLRRFPHPESPGNAMSQVFASLGNVYQEEGASPLLIVDIIIILRALARQHPKSFSTHLLRVLYAFSYLLKLGAQDKSLKLNEEQRQLFVSMLSPYSDFTALDSSDFEGLISHLNTLDDADGLVLDVIYVYFTINYNDYFASHFAQPFLSLAVTLFTARFDASIAAAKEALSFLDGLPDDIRYSALHIINAFNAITEKLHPDQQATLGELLSNIIARWQHTFSNYQYPHSLQKAVGLHNWIMHKAGRHDQVVDTMNGVVEAYTSIQNDNSGSETLAMLLAYKHRHALELQNSGRFLDALLMCRETLELWRKRDQNVKKTFPSAVVDVLLITVQLLHRFGHVDEAYELAKEVERMCSFLQARGNIIPNAPEIDAMVSTCLRICGKPDDALVKSTQAVDKVGTTPLGLYSFVEVYVAHCKNLGLLGDHNGVLSAFDSVLPWTQEGTSTTRIMREQSNRALARLLSTISSTFLALEQPANALEKIDSSISIHRSLATHYPGDLPELAEVLGTRFEILWALDRRSEAIESREEIVDIWRKCVPLWSGFQFKLEEASQALIQSQSAMSRAEDTESHVDTSACHVRTFSTNSASNVLPATDRISSAVDQSLPSTHEETGLIAVKTMINLAAKIAADLEETAERGGADEAGGNEGSGNALDDDGDKYSVTFTLETTDASWGAPEIRPFPFSAWGGGISQPGSAFISPATSRASTPLPTGSPNLPNDSSVWSELVVPDVPNDVPLDSSQETQASTSQLTSQLLSPHWTGLSVSEPAPPYADALNNNVQTPTDATTSESLAKLESIPGGLLAADVKSLAVVGSDSDSTHSGLNPGKHTLSEIPSKGMEVKRHEVMTDSPPGTTLNSAHPMLPNTNSKLPQSADDVAQNVPPSKWNLIKQNVAFVSNTLVVFWTLFIAWNYIRGTLQSSGSQIPARSGEL